MVLPSSNGDAADRPGAGAGAVTVTPVATAPAAASPPPSPAPAAATADELTSETPPALDPPSLRLAPPASTVAPLARPGPPDKVCRRPLQGHVGAQEQQQHKRACATTPTAAVAARGDEPVQAAAAPPGEAATATAPQPPAMETPPPPPPAAPDSYEATHVHAVYEAIAPHFSATRHRPWPLVSRYLAAQQPGAVGFDVGCGNGKYLSARDLDPTATGTDTTTTITTAASSEDVLMLGCDRSAALVGLARAHAGRARQVLVADGLSLPFRRGSADFALCVAVIHHLSTRDRRVAAVAELLRCLRPGAGGTALVFVWALEQASSRRGWDEGGDQDLLVPWVMKGDQGRERRKKKGAKEGREKSDAAAAAADGVTEANDDDDAAAAAAAAASQDPADANAGAPDRTFHRYYHLYRKGELEEDVAAAGGVVVDSGYERDNWWAIARRDPS
ncbi:hypothetical protein RB597_009505 [Gaeumannomyces tritici]